MVEKVVNLLKYKEISFPRLLLLHYKDLKLDESELVVLIYLLNESSEFNPKKISEDLKMTLQEVLMKIDGLTNKDLIKVELKKVDNIRKEFIDMNLLYNKLSYFIINEEVNVDNPNIYDTFEKEFGRTLSPMEYQIINGWLNDGMSEEMVILALKEATDNGVSNLRYIDKILYEWRSKGLTTKEKIEQNRTQFNKKEKKELFDYNWLDDEE